MNKENSLIIQNYMGVVFHDDENQYYSKDGLYIGKELNYTSDWNRLMEVVQCIYEGEKESTKEWFEEAFDIYRETETLFELSIIASIEEVYKYVVHYIKWYNNLDSN